MPSAAARQTRGPSAAARKAISLPLNPMLTSSRRERGDREIDRERERQRDRER